MLWSKIRRRHERVPLQLRATGKVWSVYQIRQLLVVDSQRQGPVNRVRSRDLKQRIDAAKSPAELLALIARQSSNTSMAEW